MVVNRTRSGDATPNLSRPSHHLGAAEARALGDEGSAVVSNHRRALEAFLRNGPALVGVSVVVLSILAAILAPLLVRHDPGDFDFANINQWPSQTHWFGTAGSG